MTTSISLTPERLFATPELYPVHMAGGAAQFVPMTRATYERSIFLDQRLESAGRELIRTDLQTVYALRAEWDVARAPASYIFQTALCGSTLLARALDIEPVSLVYREPICLRALAIEACAANPDREEWRHRLDLLHLLLSRSYVESERTLVKANIPCNFILPEIMSHHPDSKGLLLYQDLKPFLASVLRHAPQRDRWMRTLMANLSGVMRTLDVFRNIDLDAITRDTQVYACIWIAQIYQFRSLLESEGHRLRTINSETLYRQPRSVIESAFSFLDIEVSAGQVDQIMQRPLWHEHAKFRGYSFRNADREAVLADQYRKFSAEIDAGSHFAEKVLAPTDLAAPLGQPLMVVA